MCDRAHDVAVALALSVVDPWQSEISKSLKQCSGKVLELREDMKDYTESAERIREDIKTLRNRCGCLSLIFLC